MWLRTAKIKVAMNRIDRLTGILLLLQEQPRTSEEIARHFEVSRRTVLRDVQALCEIGVPIVAREGAGGGYSLPDSYAATPLPLTAREAFLLLLALSAITRLGDAPFAEERASLAAKLRATLPAPQLADAEDLLAAVAVELPQRLRPAPFLDALVAAARDKRWVRVTYQSAERRSTQHLLPRQVFTQNGLWYCRALAHERGEERTYRVDRIAALDPLGADFAPIDAPAPPPYHHEAHPEVVVALTPRGAAYVEGEPHIGALVERGSDGAGRLTFRCPPAELAWFARYFASLGADADVRSPPDLRERIRRIGEQIVDQYSDW
jgi:predicted DNA-binding transcriptional regulator YafY